MPRRMTGASIHSVEVMQMPEYLKVPRGKYKIGATREEISRAVHYWKDQLLEDFTAGQLERWMTKEYPAFLASVEEFAMSRTLVTNEEYGRFVAATGVGVCESLLSPAQDDHPAWGMTIEQAGEYCAWLSLYDPSFTYRLPREVEWEAAARGLGALEYPYGSEFDPTKANTVESGFGITTPVEHYAHAPGPFGHLDLAGNVEEWVDDRYWVYPGGDLIVDDLYETFGMDYFILRGGSFHRGGDLSRGARRHGRYPKPDYRYTGFRVVRVER